MECLLLRAGCPILINIGHLSLFSSVWSRHCARPMGPRVITNTASHSSECGTPGSYRCWLSFLKSVSLLPTLWPKHLGGGHPTYLVQRLPGDLRGHSLPISTSLVSARAKSGPGLPGPHLSCDSHSPALASQAKKGWKRKGS